MAITKYNILSKVDENNHFYKKYEELIKKGVERKINNLETLEIFRRNGEEFYFSYCCKCLCCKEDLRNASSYYKISLPGLGKNYFLEKNHLFFNLFFYSFIANEIVNEEKINDKKLLNAIESVGFFSCEECFEKFFKEIHKEINNQGKNIYHLSLSVEQKKKIEDKISELILFQKEYFLSQEVSTTKQALIDNIVKEYSKKRGGNIEEVVNVSLLLPEEAEKAVIELLKIILVIYHDENFNLEDIDRYRDSEINITIKSSNEEKNENSKELEIEKEDYSDYLLLREEKKLLWEEKNDLNNLSKKYLWLFNFTIYISSIIILFLVIWLIILFKRIKKLVTKLVKKPK